MRCSCAGGIFFYFISFFSMFVFENSGEGNIFFFFLPLSRCARIRWKFIKERYITFLLILIKRDKRKSWVRSRVLTTSYTEYRGKIPKVFIVNRINSQNQKTKKNAFQGWKRTSRKIEKKNSFVPLPLPIFSLVSLPLFFFLPFYFLHFFSLPFDCKRPTATSDLKKKQEEVPNWFIHIVFFFLFFRE